MKDQAQKLRDIMSKDSKETETSSSSHVNQNNQAKIITVTSGKGGVGKTSFSVNLALGLADLGKKVLLIDADFGLSNVDLMLGVNSKHNLNHFLNKEVPISDIINEAYPGLSFISGGSGVYDLLMLKEDGLQKIMEQLLQLEYVADIIIFDTGAGVNNNILKLIRSSSEVFIVTTPEPTSIMDAYAMVKTIHSKSKGDIPSLYMIMNRAENNREALGNLYSLCQVIEKYIDLKVRPLGYILEDKAIKRSIIKQKPLLYSYPNSKAAINIKQIAQNYNKNSDKFVPKKRLGLLGFLRRLWR